MSIDWDELVPPKPAPEPLTGPEMIFPGRGCRVIGKSVENEETRGPNLLGRMYEVVAALLADGNPDISDVPTPGFTRIYGGEPAVFVRGDDERGVLTSIGRGIIGAKPSTASRIAELGFRALVEW